MRNRLVHAYFDVDLDIVWNTITTAIPQLITQIIAIQTALDNSQTHNDE
jgi:uncharacterized protein with HEPN domain